MLCIYIVYEKLPYGNTDDRKRQVLYRTMFRWPSDDFRHLVRRYQSALIASLTYRLKNRDRAKETAQETFIRAYCNLARLKKPDSFLPWLTSIANSVAREYRRKDKILLRQDDVSSISQTTSSAERPPDVELDRAISALPDAYRKISLLRYYSGQSCSQVAESLVIPLCQ
jgi:RNA polymerase sigma-70 factor, ECF subfamily